MAAIRWATRKGPPVGSWLAKIAGSQTTHAGGDSAGEQIGPDRLGTINQERSLSNSAADCIGIASWVGMNRGVRRVKESKEQRS